MQRPRVVVIAFACLAFVYIAIPSARGASHRPRPNAILGQIFIKKIGVNLRYVQEGDGPPGFYPVHLRRSALPGEGAVVLIGHHFTHPLPGAAGGPFFRLDQLRRGDLVKLTLRRRLGGGTYWYRVTSDRTIRCGYTPADFEWCERLNALVVNRNQDKLYLVTCIGHGYRRRIVTAFAVHSKRS